MRGLYGGLARVAAFGSKACHHVETRKRPPVAVFSFERTLKRPDKSPRAAEYGFSS